MIQRIRRFLFTNQTTRQTIAKNAFWMASSTIIIRIIRAFIIIYAARLLGTEGYGIFTYTMSIAAMFAIFSDIGLTNILTRELANDNEQKRHYLSTALVVKGGLLVGAFLLILAVGPFITRFDAAKPLLGIMALSIAFESMRSFLYAITRAQNNMQVEAGLGVMSELTCTVFVLAIFLRHPSVYTLALAYLIGNGISFLITAGALRRSISGISRYFKRALVQPIIRAALPFAIMGVFGVFMTNIDSVIIGIFGTPDALGLYAAAQRPISLLYVVPGFLSVSFFTIISQLAKKEKHGQLSALIKKGTLLGFGLAFPITIGGIILAGPLIQAVFGASYIGATLTFQLLLLALPAVFSGTVFADVILAEDKQRVFIKISIISAIINVGLDLLLIPKIGIAGSAIATVVAQTLMSSMWFSVLRKNYTLGLTKSTLTMLSSALVMGAAAYGLLILSAPLVAIILVAVGVYIGMLAVLKEPMLQEFKRLFLRR